MKFSKLIIIILFLQINFVLNAVIIDEFDTNVGYIDIIYSNNNNKYLSLNYNDNIYKYFKQYDNKENLIKEEKSKHENKKIKQFYYYPNTDNYVKVIDTGSYDKTVQVVYNNHLTELKLEKYSEISSIAILGDNTLVIIQEDFSNDRKFLLFSYPPNENPKSTFTQKNASDRKRLLAFGLQNTIALIDFNSNKKLELKIIGKDSKELVTKSLSTDNDDYFTATYIDLKNKNLFLLCLVLYTFTLGDVKCRTINYDNNNNKVTMGEYLTVFKTCPSTLQGININLIENNKIALGCSASDSIYISIVEYSSGKLKPGAYFDSKVVTKKSGMLVDPYINNYVNKGYILYYIYGETSKDKSALYKTTFNPTCSNINNHILNYVSNREKFSFNDYINSGIGDSKVNFKIVSINKNINMYYKNKKITAGNTDYPQDANFEIEAKYTTEEMKIIYSIQKQNCFVKIVFKEYDFQIWAKKEKCIKKKDAKINYILHHDLKTIFDKKESKIEFTIDFYYEITKNELNILYKGKKLKCKKTKKTKITCQSPIPRKEYKSIKHVNEYRIESKFVCENLIFIETLKIGDPYIIETYDASNLNKLTQTINKNYDPAQVISKFDLNMITYYYWFSCYAHCTIDEIDNNRCCTNYLKDWSIFDKKGFYKSYLKYIQEYFMYDHEIEEILKQKLSEINLDEFRYIIFKSDKYKKYVIAFGCYDDFFSFYLKMLLSEMALFDIYDKSVKVNGLVKEVFQVMEKHLFSDAFINDLNQNKDYQIIFTGHSFGGAVACLSIYSFRTNYFFYRNPILITFGQPRIGNENFAKKFNSLIPNVYRIAATDDYVTMIPAIKEKKLLDLLGLAKYEFIVKSLTKTFEIYYKSKGNPDQMFINLYSTLVDDISSNIQDEIKENYFNNIFGKKEFEAYCHIGGLYILNKERNIIVHCRDFGNEETGHYICKNYDMTIFNYERKNDNYFLDNQNMVDRCKKQINFKK